VVRLASHASTALDVEGGQDHGNRFQLLDDVICLPVGIRLATLP
jgi:hypothetical protein